MEFYLSMDCDCGEEMYYGVCLTLLEHNGLPVVSFDMAAQMSFTCDGPDGCGKTTYTGDFETFDDD